MLGKTKMAAGRANNGSAKLSMPVNEVPASVSSTSRSQNVEVLYYQSVCAFCLTLPQIK